MTRMLKRWSQALFFIQILVFPVSAWAICGATATNLDFGVYDLFARTPNLGTGTITVSCDEAPPADVSIQITPSLNSGLLTPRRMIGPNAAFPLDYNIFTDASMTTIWGDGTGASSSVFLKNVTKNKSRTVIVYGTIFPSQNVPSGSYQDSLTATIMW